MQPVNPGWSPPRRPSAVIVTPTTMDSYLSFIFACCLILVVPGPTILLVVSLAMRHGSGAVVPLVGGVVLGDFTAMGCSLLGLGAVLSVSAALFTWLKILGACYLVFLGVDLWRSGAADRPEPERSAEPVGEASKLLLRTFVVTATNPKGIVFFVAFLPQFIDPSRPIAGQLALLGGTFLLLAVANATFYAILAGRLRLLLRGTRGRLWGNRVGGATLIAVGLAAASWERGSS